MWEIKLFVDEEGRQAVRAWLNSLASEKRTRVIAAIETHLTEMGPAVVLEDMGTDHGGGLLEFVVYYGEEEPEGRLRIFFCVYGDLVILLGGLEDASLQADGELPPRVMGAMRERLRSLSLWVEREKLGQRRRG